MQNDRRRLWSTILFVILFGTFAVVFALSFVLGPKRLRSGAPATTSPGAKVAGPSDAGGMPAAPRPQNSQLLVAGDGRAVWMLRPVVGENNTPGYELFRRTANTGTWRVALRNSGSVVQDFWNTPGLPQALVLLRPPAGQTGESTPYVLFGATAPGMLDLVYSFSLEEGSSLKNPLPPNHVIKAAVGGARPVVRHHVWPACARCYAPGRADPCGPIG